MQPVVSRSEVENIFYPRPEQSCLISHDLGKTSQRGIIPTYNSTFVYIVSSTLELQNKQTEQLAADERDLCDCFTCSSPGGGAKWTILFCLPQSVHPVFLVLSDCCSHVCSHLSLFVFMTDGSILMLRYNVQFGLL